MAKQQKQVDPEFSREAAGVLHSPYFFADNLPEGEWRDRSARRDRLTAAVQRATTYDDLKGEDRQTYDVAKAAIADYLNDSDLRERMQEEPLLFAPPAAPAPVKEAKEGEAAHGGGAGAAASVRELTHEESALLLAGILDAMARGDRPAAERIAGLAKMPDRIKEVLGQAGEGAVSSP